MPVSPQLLAALSGENRRANKLSALTSAFPNAAASRRADELQPQQIELNRLKLKKAGIDLDNAETLSQLEKDF